MNFLVSKYKGEYIITVFFLVSFWYIISNYIVIGIFFKHISHSISDISLCVSFFSYFACNYDNLLSSFNLFCNQDYHSKKFFYSNGDLEFKFFESILNMLKSWFKSIDLTETIEYDVIGGVQKLIVKEMDFLRGNHLGYLKISPRELEIFYDYEMLKSWAKSSFHLQDIHSINENVESSAEVIYDNSINGSNKYKELVRSDFAEQIKSHGGINHKNF